MRRREFLGTRGGSVTFPRMTSAQPASMPVIEMLNIASAGPYVPFMAAFRSGLGELGFVEGQNVAIEARWADGESDRLPVLAADLVRRQVAVIVCGGGNLTVPAAMASTKTIPIVFSMGGDPVSVGFVARMSRPGGNITGVAQMSSVLMAKQMELLREVAPGSKIIGFLASSGAADAETQLQTVREAARILGAQIVVARAGGEQDLDRAFAELVGQHADAAVIGPGAFFTTRNAEIAALAMRHRLPTVYARREYPASGGLMSYGTSLADVYRQLGVYAGRILKGEKPADLPVVQPTKFDFAINLKTARDLGLNVPATLLVRADEVIE